MQLPIRIPLADSLQNASVIVSRLLAVETVFSDVGTDNAEQVTEDLLTDALVGLPDECQALQLDAVNARNIQGALDAIPTP
jgi:hypothetical protein